MKEGNQLFNLLLVDDNPTNLSLLAQIVEMDLPQVRVLTAESAAAALELAQQNEIDGAFVDVQMPVTSGLELCRQLKEDPRLCQTPVVLMTAHIATAQLRAEGLEAGAYDFISQPISNVEMLARIRVMLRLRQNEKQLIKSNTELRRQVAVKTSNLRWLSGLLLAGGDAVAEEDRELALKLSSRLPEDSQFNIEQFSGQLFQEMPLRWRRTVLKLALLEEIPLGLAERLAEISDIEGALDYLWRHNFFLDQDHAADRFRLQETLRERFRRQAELALTEQERGEVHGMAADWYLQQGQPLIALNYLQTAGLFSEAELLLSQYGIALVAGKWLPGLADVMERIPQEMAAKRGWLALFSGISKQQRQPQEAHEWLELARTRFVATREVHGELLALTFQVVQCLIAGANFSLGAEAVLRIEEILSQYQEQLDSFYQASGHGALAIGAIFFNQDLASADLHVREGLQFAIKSSSVELQVPLRLFLAYLGLLQARYPLAVAELEASHALIAELPQADPCRVLQQVMSCDLLLRTGDYANFHELHQRLELALGRSYLQQNTIGPILCRFLVEVLLAEGQQHLVRDRLDVCAEEDFVVCNPHLQGMMLQYRALLWCGESEKHDSIRSDLQRSLELLDKQGGLRHVLQSKIIAASCFTQTGDYLRAEQLLQQALELSVAQDEVLLRPAIFAQQAALCLCRQLEQAALAPLQQLLELLEQKKQQHFFLLTPALLRRLLPLAVQQQVTPDWAERMAQHHLTCTVQADGALLPLLEIKTLGRSEIYQQGKKILDCSELGSLSRQLLILLLMAPNHRLGLDHLLGLLWPESSSTRARASFDSNFSRLRKTLDAALLCGSIRDYLVLERGVLILRNICADCQQFDDSVKKGQLHLRRQELWQAGLAFRTANHFWQGTFLAGQDLPDELFVEQQRLTELRLDMVESWSDLLLRDDAGEEAAALLQEGIRLEPTREPLVRRLYGYHSGRRKSVQAKKILEFYYQALLADDYSAADASEIVQALECDARQF